MNQHDLGIVADRTYIPLSGAWLCLDCSCVGNNSRECPNCLSGSLLSLARVMDREDDAGEVASAEASLELTGERG